MFRTLILVLTGLIPAENVTLSAELHSKLPAESERHGWVLLFLRKKI